MYYILFFLGVSLIFFISKSIRDGNIRTKIGLRSPSNYDGYEHKGEDLFREECQEHSIATDPHNTPNLCYLVPVLNLKGLHIELIKEDNQSYVIENGKYIGSDSWQEKWRKIVFSSTISSKDFCRCIKIIMHAHKFYESDNNVLPYVKGLDGMIKEKDSFFIYRALYIMRYNIRIRRNEDCLKDISIRDALSLKQRANSNVQFINPEKELHTKLLKDIVKFHEGQYIDESKITLDKNDYGLIYASDIEKGTSSMFYRSFSRVKHIRQGYLVCNINTPFNINRWKQEDAILTPSLIALEVMDENILGDFLLFYIKRIITIVSSKNNIERLSINTFKNISILIPPRGLQKEIIMKNEDVELNLLNKHIWGELEKSIDKTAESILEQYLGDNDEVLDKGFNGKSLNCNSKEVKEINDEESLQESEGLHEFYIPYKKWVNGYYKKNGTYVRGHYRY